MKNYEEPKILVIEIEAKDVIQTSGGLAEGDETTINPGGGITFG